MVSFFVKVKKTNDGEKIAKFPADKRDKRVKKAVHFPEKCKNTKRREKEQKRPEFFGENPLNEKRNT